jgi:hypothetical protein
MASVEQIQMNVAAALDKQKLTAADKKILSDYAAATSSNCCTGCTNICGPACPEMPYIADLMRCLMYKDSYNSPSLAAQTFAQIPATARAKITSADFSKAESLCPRKLPIANLMKSAVENFA